MSTRAARWLWSLAPRATRVVRAGARTSALVIVRHHRVYAATERPLYRLGVAESVLRDQLAMLAREELTPVTVAEGLAHLDSGEPGVRVAMSFDDGYRDNLTRALPLLTRHGARATLFLAAGLIEDRRAPWWDVLAHALETTVATVLPPLPGITTTAMPLEGPAARRETLARLIPALKIEPRTREARLAAVRETLGIRDAASCALARWEELPAWTAAGGEIGAHTLTHPHLTTLDPAEQRREIAGSVTLIERRLGVRVAGFAYPGGDHDATTVAVTRESGPGYAVTTRAGVATAASPRFELPRRGFSEGTCLGPGGRFSRRLALAELDGVFDRMRAARDGVAS
ncbi:MAG: polysaccharide deacetylase family protein [Candidatus Eisenbacteria bacterium]